MRKQLPFFAAIFTMLVFSANVQAQSEGFANNQPDEKTSMSIVETSDLSFELEVLPAFPNPASQGYVIIEGQHYGAACQACLEVSIYGVDTGELVYENNFPLVNGQYEHRLDLSNIKSGMYFIVYNARDLQSRSLFIVN